MMRVTAKVNVSLPNAASLTSDVLRRMDAGAAKAAGQLLADAVSLAPMDTGALRGSGRVEKTGEGDYTVGFDTPYAARLHEHPEYDFAKDANPNAQGKYLEEPALQNRRTYAAIVAQEARQ